MNRGLVNIVLFMLVIISIQVNAAQTYTSVQDGNWQDSNTWEGGISPGFNLGESVTLIINHDIAIPDGVILTFSHYAKIEIDVDGSLTASEMVLGEKSKIDVSGSLIASEMVLGIKSEIDVDGTLTVDKLTLEKESEIDVSGSLNAGEMVLGEKSKIEGEGNLDIEILTFKDTGNNSTVFSRTFNQLKDEFDHSGKTIYDVKFSDGELPVVELSEFGATLLENGEVKINWITMSESNNEYFILEKSTDLFQWEQVEIVYGAGNSLKTNYYEVIDFNSGAIKVYYRLCQYDFDGTSECFDVIAVEHIEQTNFSIYPNPANYGQPVQIEGNPQSIKVFNALGQAVSANIQNNQIKNLSVGTYFIYLNGEMQKLIILD